jgi:TonB family protein
VRALLVVIAFTSLRARDVIAQTSASCSFDTVAHTVMQSVNLALTSGITASRDAQQDYLLAAQAIQSYFQARQQLRLPLWARTVSPDTGVAKPIIVTVAAAGLQDAGPVPPPGEPRPRDITLRGYVRFRLTAVGRLVGSNIVVDAPSPDIADAIIAAVKRADSAQAFSPPSAAVRHDDGTIWLRVLAPPESSQQSVSLLRLGIPTVVLDSAADLVQHPPITYPENLWRAGTTGHVLLRAVVLPDGQVDGHSMELLHADHRELAQLVIDAIQQSRFRPARVGGCAVAATVLLPVDFRTRSHP